VQLLTTSTALSRRVAGGQGLAVTIAQGRRTDRMVRQDRQVLTGAKGRLRTAPSADGRAVG